MSKGVDRRPGVYEPSVSSCDACKSAVARVAQSVARGRRGQLGRAVKAIDSKSIGETRVSSSLTAVDAIFLRHLSSLGSIGAASEGGVVLRIDYGSSVAV